MEIAFKSDTSYRKDFFVPESFAHPAKMVAPLLLWIVDRYTKLGETILDPMAGSGTMMLACPLGRNVVMVELEDKFCQMQRDNWEKVRQMPQLGYSMGECTIVQGDARNLEGLFDSVVTSPPYASGGHHADQTGAWGGQAQANTQEQANYGSTQGQIGQLHYVENSQPVAAARYDPSAENIGNLKSDSYLQAMLTVYQKCHSVLKPSGIMVLVTKDFIRNQKRIDLAGDTIKLCEEAGFTFIERHYRKLTAVSFWRTIYKQKYPDAPVINTEDILVFRK